MKTRSCCFLDLLVDKEAKTWTESVNKRIGFALDHGHAIGLLRDNDQIVVVTGWTKLPGHTNTVRVAQIVSFEKRELDGLMDLRHF